MTNSDDIADDVYVHYRPGYLSGDDPRAVCGARATSLTSTPSRATCPGCLEWLSEPLHHVGLLSPSTLPDSGRVHYGRIGDVGQTRPACNLDYRGPFYSTLSESDITCLLCRRALGITTAPASTLGPSTAHTAEILVMPSGMRRRILPFQEMALGDRLDVKFEPYLDGSVAMLAMDLDHHASKHRPRFFVIEWPAEDADVVSMWRIE